MYVSPTKQNMNFEDEYIKRISFLLQEHESGFDLALKELLNNAARDHELGGGNTIIRIAECCTLQIESAINLLVDTAAEMIDVYDKNISRKKVWGLISKYIDTLIETTDSKQLSAMKTAQGTNLNQRHIEASSLDDKYQFYRSEAGYNLDKALSALKEKRGKTLKDRILNRLNNSWAYLIMVFILVSLTWLFKG